MGLVVERLGDRRQVLVEGRAGVVHEHVAVAELGVHGVDQRSHWSQWLTLNSTGGRGVGVALDRVATSTRLSSLRLRPPRRRRRPRTLDDRVRCATPTGDHGHLAGEVEKIVRGCMALPLGVRSAANYSSRNASGGGVFASRRIPVRCDSRWFSVSVGWAVAAPDPHHLAAERLATPTSATAAERR